MRIPSGDLAPARRRRRGGGGYGQRRRRTRFGLLLLVVLLAAGGGAAYLLQRDDTGAVARRTVAASPSSTPCPSPTRSVRVAPLVLPPPSAVRLVLLNGTPRNGLGRTVGDQLARRGFRVTGTGNAPQPQLGASTVLFGPGGQAAATLLSRTVAGSTLSGDAKAAPASLRVVLGTGFTRLRTPAEVAALGRTARPAPTGTGAAGCR